jgi:hypothetical protein
VLLPQFKQGTTDVTLCCVATLQLWSVKFRVCGHPFDSYNIVQDVVELAYCSASTCYLTDAMLGLKWGLSRDQVRDSRAQATD